MLKILIEDSEGNSKVSPIEPEKQDITIGRKEGNYIRLKDENVSRHHARIFSSPEGLMIEPVAARYGLKVNSAKISGPTPLGIGDEIRIGDYRLYIQDEVVDVRKQREEALATAVPITEPSMQPRLVVVSSNYVGQEFRITKTIVKLGRNPDCDIIIKNGSVSGHHAEIHKTIHGDFEIVDLNSSNGTIVNNEKITGPKRIASGDIIVFGHVMMRYCGPGDLWFLSYGSYQQPRNTALIAAVIAVAIIAASVMTFVLTSKYLANKYQTPTVTTIITSNDGDEESQQQARMFELVKEASNAMKNGDFTGARTRIDEALLIDPEDDLVKEHASKLSIELSSKAALENLEKSLTDNNCREAFDELANVQPDTWASKQVGEKALVEKANKCLEDVYFTRAMNSINNGKFADAEFARNEIERINKNSPVITRIDEEIKARKPHRTGGGNANAAPAPVVAPVPEPTPQKAPEKKDELADLEAQFKSASKASDKLDLAKRILEKNPKHVEANCTAAVMDKNKGRKCEAYKRYKVVLGQSKDCSKPIDRSWMEEQKSDCEK